MIKLKLKNTLHRTALAAVTLSCFVGTAKAQGFQIYGDARGLIDNNNNNTILGLRGDYIFNLNGNRYNAFGTTTQPLFSLVHESELGSVAYGLYYPYSIFNYYGGLFDREVSHMGDLLAYYVSDTWPAIYINDEPLYNHKDYGNTLLARVQNLLTLHHEVSRDFRKHVRKTSNQNLQVYYLVWAAQSFSKMRKELKEVRKLLFVKNWDRKSLRRHINAAHSEMSKFLALTNRFTGRVANSPISKENSQLVSNFSSEPMILKNNRREPCVLMQFAILMEVVREASSQFTGNISSLRSGNTMERKNPGRVGGAVSAADITGCTYHYPRLWYLKHGTGHVYRAVLNDVNNFRNGKKLAGSFADITAGEYEDHVWACSFSGDLYKFTPNRKKWQRQRKPRNVGKISKVTVDNDGTLYLITSKSHIWKRTNNGKWSKLSGTLNDISAGGGRVWGVRADNSVWEKNSKDAWKRQPGLLKTIDVAPNGEIWGVNRQGALYCRQYDVKRWQQVKIKGQQTGKTHQLILGPYASGDVGNVWEISGNLQIKKLEPTDD